MPRKKKSEIIEKPKSEIEKFYVIRDIQEKRGFWEFSPSKYCAGTKEQHLLTADYTIEGMEHIFAIERKASTGEIAGNVCTKQFENELKRAMKFKHFFIVCEFTLADVLRFPFNSSIPKAVWPRLKITSHLLLKRIIELEMKYKCTFVFAGDAVSAKEFARSVFKRMIEQYGDEIN